MIVHAQAYIITLSEKLNPSIPISNCPNKMIIAKIYHDRAMIIIAKLQNNNKIGSKTKE